MNRTVVFLASALLVSRMPAQSAPPANPADPVAAADADWMSLKQVGRPKSNAADPRAELLADADRLKDFYTKHPHHREAKNAKCLEGLALVRAWLAGDASQKTRRDKVVDEVRRDRSVSAPLRAELFAFADHVAIAKQKGLTREGRLREYERAVRALIAEFPELPNGYESLLAIAHDSTDENAVVLAQELSRMPAVPAEVKQGAELVLARYALLGQSLPALATSVLGANHPLARPDASPIFVYSWASSSPMSAQRAKALAATMPEGTSVVGICLDNGDPDAARARAVAEKLPGLQIYDPAGVRGALAKKLAMLEPGLIYAADLTGIIRSVAAHQTLVPSPAAVGR